MPLRSASWSGYAILVVLLLLTAGVAPVASQTASNVQVRALEHSGPGVVAVEDGRTYVTGWQPSSISVVMVADPGTYDVCVHTERGDSTTSIDCQQIEATGSEQRVTIDVDEWPMNTTGEQVLVAEVHNSFDGETLAEASHPLIVFPAEGDADGDSLGNQRELERGTSIRVADTDTDGLNDGAEVNRYETDPTSTDTDGDELSDGVEVNEHGSNPNEVDTDGDGLEDGVEVTTYASDPTTGDTDGDGLIDSEEVQKYQTNPTSADTDEDGLEDGPEVNIHETSPTATDTDGDGLSDSEELNRFETNPTEIDTDGDGLEDGREVTVTNTNPNQGDTDGDGVGDGTEIEDGTDPNSAPGSNINPLGVGVQPTMVLLVISLFAIVGGGIAVATGKIHLPDSMASVRTRDGADGDARATQSARIGASGTQRVNEQPLSDEARVFKLLDQHDGQLRQSAIVEGTGWSKSKVSRVLSRMADEGEVQKINIGRENIVTRPDAVPEHAKSPFEDQQP
ncbi:MULTISPECIES: binary toxin-like calcium binding domain-containing protein [Haloferax]|uniref:Helix-turn-helix domain-containing protein n=1 Tax=Haloferax marinum TaxID=2666143 RepID=A0A6A8GAV2_9EURY|nr:MULTISPECIES: binary toxin-like calcium binding domain-containing protein [Haloferax]KAB1190684.1 helix-turn-helix domain-containing protein [Haloferax sp. CBA1150]MRW98214.1 helix-turn-helix domain-containing protein [Haloferax marinum]